MLLYGADEDVAAWVSMELFGVKDQFKLSKAIGVVKGGCLICGVVYNNQHCTPDGTPYTLEMSIASIDKSWCTRHNLRAFFGFPFTQLSLRRVQTTCSANEGNIIMFNERLGFKKEGFHREAWPLGGDAISFGMLKSDCRWL